MSRSRTFCVTLPALLAATLLITSCTENVVYRDRDMLGGVPAAAAGFLGYANPATKQTVCGACHVSQQRRWQSTAHAGAWATLQAAPAREQLCEGCHTVTNRGNQVTEANVGFNAVGEVRFHDVQCEACHGPGLNHVRNPDAPGNVPHAAISAAIGANGTCAECHSGLHHPFVEEWQDSRHARVIASAANNPSCRGCHEAKSALDQMGVRANYAERGTAGHIAITCAVCHDPHENEYAGQLRFSTSVPSEQENLCMRCHQKRGQPDPTTFRGPHAPEGPLLLGDAGWWPPNMPIEPGQRIATTHGSTANPRLCAGCHVNRFTTTDRLTGLPIETAGHSFKAIPCLDAEGRPTAVRDCEITQRTFVTCTQAGCHGSQAAARNALTVARVRLHTLAATLNAQLAQVPASEFSDTDNRYTTAEGARFNAQLAVFRGTEVHNPFLAEALLIASIQQVEREYGIAPSPSISLDHEFGEAH
jgi:predicted CXXCH cytochrome family protein